jgi:hypothetical protein
VCITNKKNHYPGLHLFNHGGYYPIPSQEIQVSGPGIPRIILGLIAGFFQDNPEISREILVCFSKGRNMTFH